MPSCRKKGGKKGKSKIETYKIVSESTETVRFVPKIFFRKIMMSFWLSAKESDSRYDSLCLRIQSSPEHRWLNAFETPQLTLRAMWNGHKNSQCCVCLNGAKSSTGFRPCATTPNNTQQHELTCNSVCKRTLHVTSKSTGSCWPTMLRPFAKKSSNM